MTHRAFAVSVTCYDCLRPLCDKTATTPFIVVNIICHTFAPIKPARMIKGKKLCNCNLLLLDLQICKSYNRINVPEARTQLDPYLAACTLPNRVWYGVTGEPITKPA